jgi:hypothetical protein
MNKSRKNNQCISSHSFWEKLSFGQRLAEFWQDLQHKQNWKHAELSPAQLLEGLKLLRLSPDNDELARANLVLGSPAAPASGGQLCGLAYGGSRAAVLAIHRSPRSECRF